ncbi:hypothetical protein [Bdellovibrio reynosensis]|uniref:Porin n=1 Tax=Bdellovibrio reynosensis TaxID=2835041 RepID=A0ABY4C9F0_9BACT|nr:hypothetical protein [Bdellovibrio reynosensis]UOF01612.1 hypothetical protein MNR06_01425 [Bdellovibrio reynosensis]
MIQLKIRHCLFALFSFLFISQAQAYPDFIGYSYSSCITCHYNGLGGGALNDYGRALFATEITARDIFPDRREEEEIAAMSGFLGKKKLPWWIRPGLKYRGLWLRRSPDNTPASSTYMYFEMQNDINLNLFADKKQKYSLITTASYTGKESHLDRSNPQYTWFAKEFYLRYQQNKNLWLYVGLMDKVYGIRHPDHTAFNRKDITLGQHDQSQGVVVHFTYPTWDIAVNAFIGNQANLEEKKQKGFSAAGEYQMYENYKVGASFLTSQSEMEKWNLLGVTSRMGLSKGSAILAEFGLKEKTNLTDDSDAQLGTYAWVESLISLRRGYNLLSTLEHKKDDINKSSNETMKWSFGALMFPLPRLEVRTMFTNTKFFQATNGKADDWTLHGQVHISY